MTIFTFVVPDLYDFIAWKIVLCFPTNIVPTSPNYYVYFLPNFIIENPENYMGGVMVYNSMVASYAVDRGSRHCQGHTKDFKLVFVVSPLSM